MFCSSLRSRILSWLHDKFMFLLIGRSIIYNMSWEDPRIDVDLFKFTEDDVVVTLTSAGDQVLDYCLERPKKVICADLNPRQNALLELKLAAIRELDFESFFSIFGASNGHVFRESYNQLRPHLSPQAASFWDANQKLFNGSFFWSGACGRILRFFLFIVRYGFMLNGFLNRLQHCRTIEEQRQLYHSYRFQLGALFAIVNVTRRFWAPFIAVPSSQLALYKGNIIKKVFDSIMERTLVARDNYFYYGQLYGRWTQECCPRYLKQENFETLKSMVPRIELHYGRLEDALFRQPDGSVTCMSLLDHMDWLKEEDVVRTFSVYQPKLATNARLLWRSYSEEQHIAPLQYLDFQTDTVEETLRRCPDRVMMYNSTYFAVVPEDFKIVNRNRYTPKGTILNDMRVLYNMMLNPIKGKEHKQRLESFYKGQATSYDSYRHRFLHGRWPMAVAMPTPQDAVWVDMGGGTAANLEFFRDELSTFKKVYVLDLCSSLLKVADQRVRANGWQDRVALVEGDATDASLIGKENGLPPAGTVDIVTFSYSLTMIPKWKEALDLAKTLLKPGGHIAVCDFTVSKDNSKVTRKFWPWVFKHDGVNLSEVHTATLKTMFDERALKLNKGGFPYVPVLKCPYYYFVGQKPLSDDRAIA